ncbi:hypothetical protein [Streptosporangium sp. NPDC000239]|uniref:hypothetical protein n=1 Tax=unclassified Streptosporangium TaxID=2632669 RepID=UPI00331B1EF8
MDRSGHTLFHADEQSPIFDRMRELLAHAAQDPVREQLPQGPAYEQRPQSSVYEQLPPAPIYDQCPQTPVYEKLSPAPVYDQRPQGTGLDEIRQRLDGVEWLLREARDRESGLNGTLESVTGRLDKALTRPPAWVQGLAQHVEAVRDHVDSVGARVGFLTREVKSVGAQIVPLDGLPRLWADLSAVSEKTDEALTRLRVLTGKTQDNGETTERLGRLQTGMDAAAGRFTRLDKGLGELVRRTGSLEKGLPELSAGFQGVVAEATRRLSDAVEQVSGKIDMIMVRLDGLTEDVGDCLSDLDRRLAALERRMTETNERLGEIAARHEARFDALDERLDDVEGRTLNRIEAVDARLRTLDGHTGRPEDVQAHVTGAGKRLKGLLQTREQRRLDPFEERVAQARAALAPLGDTLRAQPGRERLTEALTRAVEPAGAGPADRLGALEETVLVLAEALLCRPHGNGD